jgi:hypothetical protein
VIGIQLAQTDGGITTIPGRSSMVSGAVVWSEVDSPSSAFDTIERRVEEAPGRFRLTHTFQAPPSAFGRRFADEQNWWRDTLWASIDSNRTVLRTTPNAQPADFRLIDDHRPIEIRSEGLACDLTDGGCWADKAFDDRVPRAVGVGTVWVESDLGVRTVEGVARPLRVGAQRVSGPSALQVNFPEEQAGRIEAPSFMFALEHTTSSNTEVLIERPDGLFELWPLPPGGTVVNVNAGVVEMAERNGTSVLWFR